MAAAKKKTKASPKKKTSSQPAQTQWLNSAPARLCIFLCIVALSVITILRLGFIGQILFYIMNWLFGWLAWIMPVLICLVALFTLFKARITIRRRYVAAGLFLVIALLLAFGIYQYKLTAAPKVMQEFLASSRDIFAGVTASAGFFGSLFYWISASLVSRMGAYVIDILLMTISFILFLYDQLYKAASDSAKAHKEKALAKQIQSQMPEIIEAHPEEIEEDLPKKASFLSKLKDKIFMDIDEEDEAEDELTDEDSEQNLKFVPSGSSSFKVINADQEVQNDSLDVPLDVNPDKKRKVRERSIGILADEPDAFNDKLDIVEDESLDSLIDQTNAALQKRISPTVNRTSPPVSSPVENREPQSFVMARENYDNYKLPKLTLLNNYSKRNQSNANSSAAKSQGQKLISILKQFNVDASLIAIHIGPSVTKFEIKLEPGVRVNRISSLQGDIKMALAATDIRIEAPIPGKSAVGIEIPNVEKTVVHMKEVISRIPSNLQDKKLVFALGKDLMGENVFGRLDKMPHLLIAGATGSGKSVCVNSIISSILLRTRPDEVKLVLIDPKKVEFTPYNDVPHLLAPVVTDGDLANKALQVVVKIMDHRYDLFEACGVRNIESYNRYLDEHPDEKLQKMSRIVVIIDELADLMLVAAKEVEQSIQRITQLARAAGIHLVVATQRPSVDVITGIIKANIPSRIAFAVSSAVDSRTILDQTGAEKLLGYGDMLYLPNGETACHRVQGVYIEDEEVERITDFVKKQAKPHYDDSFIALKDLASQGKEVSSDPFDPLYDEVKHFVIQSQKASTSLIQRKFSIGYARAARLMDVLEDNGIIGPSNGAKPRKILVKGNMEDDEFD